MFQCFILTRNHSLVMTGWLAAASSRLRLNSTKTQVTLLSSGQQIKDSISLTFQSFRRGSLRSKLLNLLVIPLLSLTAVVVNTRGCALSFRIFPTSTVATSCLVAARVSRSFLAVWITVTHCCTALLTSLLGRYSQFRTLP